MTRRFLWIGLAAAAVMAVAGYGLYALGMHQGMAMGSMPLNPGEGAAAAGLPQTIAQGEEATRRHIADRKSVV